MPRELRIAFIGAGDVNFGGGEGPWDHASRLEKIAGLRVVGIADPNVARAKARLTERKQPLFAGARVYADHRLMLAEARPDAVWIGVPPNAHGTAEAGKALELDCLAAGANLFIEKPLSAARPEAVRPVAEALAQSKLVVSVGYMFRYSKALDAMKSVIAQTPGGVKAFLGKYNCAYSEIRKREWYDTEQSGGPIVEQATHFVDLARYLCGEADLSTIRSLRLEGRDPLGQLTDVARGPDGRPYDEGLPDSRRHPRTTAAIWKFASGALGSLNHAAWLHRKRYATSIEVWGDGLQLVLDDPYGECVLRIRRPHSEAIEERRFAGDDPYLTEDQAFVAAIRSGDRALIRSPYADAFRTFELTWAIRTAEH